MFIQSLEGSWLDHPFWKSKFLLTEADDLRALQSSGVESVWVDRDKSLAPSIAHLIAPDPAPVAATQAPVPPEPPAVGSPSESAPPAAPAIAARPKRVPRPNEYHAA